MSSSSAQKAFELQRQVRHNAEEYRNHVSDLYSWEKEIKSKEAKLKYAPPPSAAGDSSAETITAPIRSHVENKQSKQTTSDHGSANSSSGPSDSTATTPTEKQDLPVDPVAQQHKKANDIKDRGNSYVKLGEYDRAIEAYDEAVTAYPYDPIYYINRALCYLKKECYDECVEDCEAAISLDKLCVKAYYRRMQANESLGNNMEALKDCTTVLAIEPKNAEAKRSLQRINDRLRSIAKCGPNFNETRSDLIDILPIDKPAYKRSKEPMRRVPIVDIVSPRASKDEPKQLRISDDDIDKIFNSNCGPFEEVAKKNEKASPTLTNKEVAEEKPKIPKIETNKEEKKQQKDIKPENKTVETPTKEPAQVREKQKVEKNSPVNEIKEERPLPPPPTGTAQFYITWKELSADQKYKYLKSIDVTKLCKILGAGFDSDTLTSILRTLHDFYVPHKEPTTAAVLLEMSKNDEFSILEMLLSTEEKTMLSAIMKGLRGYPCVNTGMLNAIAKAYHI